MCKVVTKELMMMTKMKTGGLRWEEEGLRAKYPH